MNYTYNKELTANWQAKAIELGIVTGEFTIDGIKFCSEEEIGFTNGSHWSTLTVWADGDVIYKEENELKKHRDLIWYNQERAYNLLKKN